MSVVSSTSAARNELKRLVVCWPGGSSVNSTICFSDLTLEPLEGGSVPISQACVTALPGITHVNSAENTEL